MTHHINQKDDAELVYIPAGEFWMGEGTTKHKIYLDAYYIYKCEVTFEQYDKFCLDTNRAITSDYKFGRDNRPVIDVSWYDAMAYASWAECRLPTEAEWENACRASSNTKFSFGDDPEFLGEYAWFLDNSNNKTHPVGEKKPNLWGIYDMHGNVWEWCADWYDREYYAISPSSNPKGPSSGRFRVLRGGAWNCYLPDSLSSAVRYQDSPEQKGFDRYGFRCVLDVK